MVCVLARQVCGWRQVSYARCQTPKKRRPGQHFFGEKSRAFGGRAWERVRAVVMPALHGVVQFLCAFGMATGEPTYRLYSCACCGVQVQICLACDRGHIYCAGPCAQERRRESLRRASRRYQRSRRGALRHAARQSTWRRRRAEKVTHHASGEGIGLVTVIGTSMDAVVTDAPPADAALPSRAASPVSLLVWRPTRPRCAFCRQPLPRLVRLGPLRGGP